MVHPDDRVSIEDLSRRDLPESPDVVPTRAQILKSMGQYPPKSLIQNEPSQAETHSDIRSSPGISNEELMEKLSNLETTIANSRAAARLDFSAADATSTTLMQTSSHTSVEKTLLNNSQGSGNISQGQQSIPVQNQHSEGQGQISQEGDRCPADVMEKVYRMLKPSGVWAKILPKLYEDTYGETLQYNFPAAAEQWPDFFTVESLVTGRAVVYPRPEAADKLPSVCGQDVSDGAETCVVMVPKAKYVIIYVIICRVDQIKKLELYLTFIIHLFICLFVFPHIFWDHLMLVNICFHVFLK